MDDFFEYSNYREFLKARYDRLKASRPGFSARSFARRVGLKAPSYFQMVVDGKRNLTPETSARFAVGLGLSKLEAECLLNACAAERCTDNKARRKIFEKLAKLRRSSSPKISMDRDHAVILADPLNLKLYLLAQSSAFKLDQKWIAKHLPRKILSADLGSRIAKLLDSGLWYRSGDHIRTIAPTIHAQDGVHQLELAKTHENLLEMAKNSIVQDTDQERVMAGQTFLFDVKRMSELKDRLNAFRSEIEADFECLDATQVFQLHIAFFELGKQR